VIQIGDLGQIKPGSFDFKILGERRFSTITLRELSLNTSVTRALSLGDRGGSHRHKKLLIKPANMTNVVEIHEGCHYWLPSQSL